MTYVIEDTLLPALSLTSGLPLPFFVPYRCSGQPRMARFEAKN
jgi:hypothetical protein